MTVGVRYKFIGSTIKVQTALGNAVTVTDITRADPGVVTAAGHGAVEGDAVYITDTNIPDGLYPVDNPTSSTFEIATDTTNYDAFVAGSPTGDSRLRVVTFSTFCELTGLNQQDGGADQYDATTICSTAKEFEQGLSDSGELTLDFNWAGKETVQAALRAAKISGDQIAVKVTFPGAGGIALMFGTVQTTSFSGSVGDGIWRASASIKLSGEVFVL